MTNDTRIILLCYRQLGAFGPYDMFTMVNEYACSV